MNYREVKASERLPEETKTSHPVYTAGFSDKLFVINEYGLIHTAIYYHTLKKWVVAVKNGEEIEVDIWLEPLPPISEGEIIKAIHSCVKRPGKNNFKNIAANDAAKAIINLINKDR